MTTIKELTPEQLDAIPKVRDEWMKIGLCTDPADRPRAEAGIVKAYQIAGFGPPKIIWCDSPLAQAIARTIVQTIWTNQCREIMEPAFNKIGSILNITPTEVMPQQEDLDAITAQYVDKTKKEFASCLDNIFSMLESSPEQAALRTDIDELVHRYLTIMAAAAVSANQSVPDKIDILGKPTNLPQGNGLKEQVVSQKIMAKWSQIANLVGVLLDNHLSLQSRRLAKLKRWIDIGDQILTGQMTENVSTKETTINGLPLDINMIWEQFEPSAIGLITKLLQTLSPEEAAKAVWQNSGFRREVSCCIYDELTHLIESEIDESDGDKDPIIPTDPMSGFITFAQNSIDADRSSTEVIDNILDDTLTNHSQALFGSIKAKFDTELQRLSRSTSKDGCQIWQSVEKSVKNCIIDTIAQAVSLIAEQSPISVDEDMKRILVETAWHDVWNHICQIISKKSVEGELEAFMSQATRSIEESVFAQHDAAWLAFYKFFHDHCGLVKETEKLAGLWEIAQSAGWFIPHEKICWVSERHSEVHLVNGRLHRDGGPAIRYPDGWSVWALNGVRVPQWLAETPSGQLDCQKILQLTNVEQRREGVRKVGAEALVHKLGATTIDSEDGYELLQIDLGLDTPSIAIKMQNPSVPELWHVEFVPETCRTVADALNWRNSLTAEMIDDENGAEWQQQGDVIIRPAGATKFKSRPNNLT